MICILVWSPDTTVIGNSSLHLLIKEHWCRCRSVGTPLLQRIWFVRCILAKNQALQGKISSLASNSFFETVVTTPLTLSLSGTCFSPWWGARPTTRSLPVSRVLCVQLAWRTVYWPALTDTLCTWGESFYTALQTRLGVYTSMERTCLAHAHFHSQRLKTKQITRIDQNHSFYPEILQHQLKAQGDRLGTKWLV